MSKSTPNRLQTAFAEKTVLLAAPRGFCAGVDRAIQIVEQSLEKFGAPVYVRHEIVHNRHVVNRLIGLGAIFVDELDDCPDDRPVVFSAHGVPKSVPRAAQARDLTFLDATCPLVSKVHVEAEKHFSNGHHILLIGHKGHPEVIGTMGQLDEGAMTLIETEDDARNFTTDTPHNLALVTQTTLSVDDTKAMIDILKARFPNIALPLIIGSVTSSNSKRLVEVGAKAGATDAMLISNAESLDWDKINQARTIGLSAGASAPEYLTDGVLAALKSRYNLTIKEVEVTKEEVIFRLPRLLREAS